MKRTRWTSLFGILLAALLLSARVEGARKLSGGATQAQAKVKDKDKDKGSPRGLSKGGPSSDDSSDKSDSDSALPHPPLGDVDPEGPLSPEELSAIETDLVFLEDEWHRRALIEGGEGQVETMFTPGGTMIPLDRPTVYKGQANIAPYFRTLSYMARGTFESRFSSTAVLKCYSRTLCTRHGLMSFKVSTWLIIPDARQLAIYARQRLQDGQYSPWLIAEMHSSKENTFDPLAPKDRAGQLV